MHHGDTEYRNLKCDLTKDEVNSRAEQVSILIGERDQMETKRKTVDGAAKEEIKSCDGDIGQLARQVRERAEYRDVECLWENDGLTMALVRKDVGEIVWERPLTDSERQVKMFPAEVVAVGTTGNIRVDDNPFAGDES